MMEALHRAKIARSTYEDCVYPYGVHEVYTCIKYVKAYYTERKPLKFKRIYPVPLDYYI